MKRKALVVLSLLVAGCASEAVSTPEQAKAIALSSACAQAEIAPDPNETLPTEWLVQRKGDKWIVWLPYGPGARFQDTYGHKGAWINAKDGKVLYCERGGAQP